MNVIIHIIRDQFFCRTACFQYTSTETFPAFLSDSTDIVRAILRAISRNLSHIVLLARTTISPIALEHKRLVAISSCAEKSLVSIL